MAVVDALHQLVHALSKTEKKYFKEYSHGQNYVKLFDAVNAQEEYDEEKLKRKFKNEVFSKNFSVAKNYLYEAILRALRQFNSGKLMDDVTYEKLQNLKLLNEKGLSNMVEKQLPKLKELCYRYEQYARLFEVLTFESQFNNGQIRSNRKIFDERLRLLKILENITRLNAVYDDLMVIATNSGHDVNASVRKKIEDIMQSVSIKESELCGEADELYALWNVDFVYYYLVGNFRESYLAKKKQFLLYAENDVIIKTRPKTHLLLLSNLASLAYNIPDKAEFDFAYGEMLKAHERVQGYEALKFEQRSNFGLLGVKLSGNHRALDELVKYIETNLPKYGSELTLVRELDVYFNLAVGLFRKGDYSRALDWLNKVTAHERAEERLQVQRYARQLELLVHYELKNNELLDYKITNNQRYLTKRGILDEFDRVLISGFRKLIKAAAKSELRKALLEMKENMQALPKDSLKKINDEQFEYLAWVEKKLQA